MNANARRQHHGKALASVSCLLAIQCNCLATDLNKMLDEKDHSSDLSEHFLCTFSCFRTAGEQLECKSSGYFISMFFELKGREILFLEANTFVQETALVSYPYQFSPAVSKENLSAEHIFFHSCSHQMHGQLTSIDLEGFNLLYLYTFTSVTSNLPLQMNRSCRES